MHILKEWARKNPPELKIGWDWDKSSLIKNQPDFKYGKSKYEKTKNWEFQKWEYCHKTYTSNLQERQNWEIEIPRIPISENWIYRNDR